MAKSARAQALPPGRGERHNAPLHFHPLTAPELAAALQVRGRVNLDEEVYLARHYYAQLHNQGAERRHVELAEELFSRLEQMNFLLKSVGVFLAAYSERRFEDAVRDEQGADHLWFMMFLHAEAFYYFAHRVQDLLEDEQLPHISGFKRSKMITIIRNHLIEHPFGHYKDFSGSHGAMSNRDGPIILVRGPGTPPKKLRPHQDPGLFPNARELCGILRPVLERALEAMGGPAQTLKEALRTGKA